MGLRVGLFTSCGQDIDLEAMEDIEILNQESPLTTTFKNQYSGSERNQVLLERAPDLDLNLLPDNWKNARIIHFAPVANEIAINSGELIADSPTYYSLQGWLRKWDNNGEISPIQFPNIPRLPGNPLGGFLSIEDLGNDRTFLDPLRDLFPLLILTLGPDGAQLYQGQNVSSVPSPPVSESDPTGAGDIFATAFIIDNVIHKRSKIDSAVFASALAALSTTKPGQAGIPSSREIKEIQEVP
jgi:hypothetical protein